MVYSYRGGTGMNYDRWIGRYVTILRVHEDKACSGRIDGWDLEKRRLVLGPKPTFISFEDILKITVTGERPYRWRASAGRTAGRHTVGYKMKDRIQFENAIHFHSPVTIWKGDQVVKLRAVIVSHNAQQVVLRTGEVLNKQEHCFVVRSVRGN